MVQKTNEWKRWLLVGVLAAAIPLSFLCGFLVVAPAALGRQAGSSAEGTPRPTQTPKSTATPHPSATPRPTAAPTWTPTPTATPDPRLDCAAILAIKKASTDLQWDLAKPGFAGKEIRFAGDVIDVEEDGRVNLNACPGLTNVMIIHGLSQERAAALHKGDPLQGHGTILKVEDFLGTRVIVAWKGSE